MCCIAMREAPADDPARPVTNALAAVLRWPRAGSVSAAGSSVLARRHGWRETEFNFARQPVGNAETAWADKGIAFLKSLIVL
jgi:hypothetical protein